ncbi:Protein CBG23391 [Caenorhabditis briggsae]|uniref:Protein CBG23391 n=1 Tax=Caenorhabditis briggsae TaxID=6238 RepID=A8Y412_CAEBR|nr:Protein CBG23391 [Caenorhabditis briggsae]CAP39632.2 Protein CBG23391 [Caenorhabditis briggsae]
MIFILIISSLVFIDYARTADSNNSFQTPPKYKWAGCENLGKCKLDGFAKPTLLILSFDGFAKEYLERKIVKSLELIAECGARADTVYPSFPSKTFPNHYTMVTGLYPESHGITDNNVFDPKISPDLLAMRKSEAEKYYEGEPIWSAYKRLTGRPAHCLFWVGCYFNHTGYKPDISPDYNQELPLQERINTLPEKERPGLITAYLHQPDAAGHKQKDIDQALEDVNRYIDALMENLYDEGLLECINIAIVSDHGMQVLNKTIEVEDYVDMKGLVLSKGVVARIHLNGTDRTIDEVADEIRCKVDGIKVNTVKDIPVRKHYSKSTRVGDLIIEGKPGTTFYKSASDGGDHGNDYYNENMHTVMFARGPSFRKNVKAPPFQNVQYMNLWLDLLGLKGAVKNNGTIGFFDSILKNPPIRENNWSSMEECPTFGSADVLPCSERQINYLKKLSTHLNSCQSIRSLPLYSTDHCFQKNCDNVLIVHKKEDSRRAVIETLSRTSSSKKSSSSDGNFSYINTKYSSECPAFKGSQTFFTAGFDEISKLASAQYEFPERFLNNILLPLSIKTEEYLNRFGTIFVISGLAADSDLDGISDSKVSVPPTHFYRIIITCKGSWLSKNPPLCKTYEEMKVLAFVFPILDGKSTMDCMSSDEVLLDYTSTIEDVERIAGIQFQIGALSHQQNVYLRRNITTSLW